MEELYFTPPYTNGGIEKSAVNLIDFAKTQVLEPGASESVHFDVAKEDMASYDSSAVKTANGGYILEAGEYVISARANAHTVLSEANFTVAADIDYSQTGRPSDQDVATNRFEEYSNAGVTYLSRANGFANYANLTTSEVEVENLTTSRSSPTPQRSRSIRGRGRGRGRSSSTELHPKNSCANIHSTDLTPCSFLTGVGSLLLGAELTDQSAPQFCSVFCGTSPHNFRTLF